MRSRSLSWLIAAATVAMTGVLSGCATMSAEECEYSDWYTIGFEDGSRGLTSDAVAGRRKACAGHGFGIDFADYQNGRTAGLEEFCRPQRGFDVGSAGQRYRGVCPTDLESAFLDAYRVGSQLHELRSAVNAASSRIQSHERELIDLGEEIDELETILIAQDTTVEDRVRVLADLKNRNERVGQVEAEIEQLIGARAAHEQALRDYEFYIADLGY